jgi:chromosome partitioning protein
LKTVCFVNQKGGVGKTSLAGNVAWLASQDRKTLIVDGDPQGSISSWLATEALRYELADVLQERIGLREAARELSPTLALLGTFGIGGELKNFSERSLESWPRCFEDLKEAAAGAGFELVVFDVSPGLGRLERMIMLACDELVLPLTPEYFAVDGLQIFKDFLEETRKRNRVEIRFEKVVLNMVNEGFFRHKRYREKVRASGYTVFEIPQDSNIPSSQIVQKTVGQFDRKAKSLPELKRLTAALVEEMVYAEKN